jgi:S1-C subfamily serine protease
MAPPRSNAAAATSPLVTEVSMTTEGSPVSNVAAPTTSIVGLAGRTATVGLLITWLDPGNPFARAGVKPGDHLMAIGGIATTSMNDLVAAMGVVAHHDAVPLDVARGARRIELSVDLGD